jgi:hypothetical protein
VSRFLRSLTIVRLLAVITILAVFVMAMRTPLDTDAFWHLRAGEWQVQERTLLRVDRFSHTRAGQPWINHSWLSQVLLYGAYALLGNLGLALYTGLLATAGMVFVYRQCEGDPIVAAFGVVLGAATAAVFWSPRPQMVSFFLSATVLYLLWLYQQKGIDRLWFLPPLMAVWANLHGGFAIGFILMVLATVGEGARWLMDGILGKGGQQEERPTFRPVLRLVVVGLVSAAAVSLNPYGPSMLAYPFRTVGIGVLRDFIQEWASPNFHQPQAWPFIWMLLGTLVAVGLSPRRLDWRDAVMVAGTAYSALLAGRNIATFAIVVTPVLVAHVNAWLDERGYRLKWDRLPVGGLFTTVNWMLLVAVAAAGLVKIAYALDPETYEKALRESLPVEAVACLEEEKPPGLLFNSYNWGGFVIWAARDYPVYVDGRTDLYDDELLRVYLQTYFAQPGWDDNLDEVGINAVLVEPGTPLARLLDVDERWACLCSDEVAVVFVREDPLEAR